MYVFKPPLIIDLILIKDSKKIIIHMLKHII